MDKITIERETLELAASLIQPLTGKGDREVYDALRAALAQKAEPPSMPQGKSLALLDLDSVEHMQGGANGPTIRLRGFINAQTGPTAPQPPIDNAFVADGCEQFSPPAEPAPVPCCGKYETCSHACTPRGKWLGRREAERAALAAQPADAQPEPVAQPLHIRALRMADMAIASWENGYAFDAHGPSREAQRLVTEALAAQPAEPVAWLHSKTGRLYDSVEEVPLADGDEWAEPLYLAAPPQPAPAAWRQWSTKQHDWDYQTDKGDLRPDTPAEPLFVAAAQLVPLTDEQRNDRIEAWSSQGWGDRLGEVVRICIAIERAHGIAAAGDKP